MRHITKRISPLVIAIALIGVDSALAATRIIGAGSGGVKDTASEQDWLTFRSNVESRSQGRLDVQLLIYGEAGSEENIISAVRRNRVQVANLSTMIISTLVPAAAVINLPFLFDSQAEADYILDNYLFDAFAELLRAQGLIFLSWSEIGFQQVYGVDPILVPSDASDVRFRVSSSRLARYFAEALGADVIPLPFAENVVGLQTGLVAAGENAIVLYARTGTAEYASHLTMTNHAFSVNFVVAGERGWRRLAAEDQAVLADGWIDLDVSRNAVRAEVQADLDRSEELGFRVHRLSDAQRAEWKSATSGVSERLLGELGPDARAIYEIVQTGKKAFAAEEAAPR